MSQWEARGNGGWVHTFKAEEWDQTQQTAFGESCNVFPNWISSK